MKRLSLLVVLLLTGCLATPQPAAEPEPIDYAQLATAALATQSGVLSVDVEQNPVVSSTSGTSTPDPARAADWTVALTVTMAAAATTDEVATAAEATRSFSEKYAVPKQWTAGIAFELVELEPDEDMPAQDRSGFPVYPESVDAGDFMAVRGAPGVRSALFGSGFSFVSVASASDLLGVQEQLSTSPVWQEGGTLWAESGRVRLTQLPDSLTDAGYAAIIDASLAYPTAQFWLEAPTTGHGWPQLFVDQVSTEEAAGIQEALAGPFSAASADVNYVIRAITADGAVDTAGILGTS